MTARRDPLIGTVLNDRYRIDAKIARGGMAMVYRGTDLRLDREIAIKVMHEHLISDDTFVERFRREAINAGRLTHPNLVAIHDQARDGDIVYLVMEYLPSVTLRRELKHRGTFTPRQAIVVLDAILAALEAVHSTGIIHRDLKPDNVLLGTDGQVKLADFGLARAVTTATTTKTLIGTVGYVAPELVTRAGADSRTDLYTVGIMFYEMLTGAQPYTDDVPIQVAYRHVHDTVPPPSDIVTRLSPRLDALVLWATSKDPEDRPADAAEFRLALAEARAEMSEAELDLGDPQIATGEHSPVLTASIDLGEEVPKEKRSRTDEIPYLEGEEDGTEADTGAADSDDADDDESSAEAAAAEASHHDADGVDGTESDDSDPDDDADRDDDDHTDGAAGAAAVAAAGVGVAGAAVAGAGAASDSPDADTTGAKAAGVADDPADSDDSGDREDADDEPESKESDSERNDKAAVVVGSAAASAGASPVRRRRRRVLTGLVAVVAVLALVAWFVVANLPTPKSIVPGELAGKPVEEVTSQLEDNDLKAEPKEVFDDKVPAGTVIGTEPVSGAELAPDSSVTVVVSKGEEKFAVPKLEGTSRDEAEAALKKVNLEVGKVEEKYSDTVAKDSVISASQKAGTKLSKGEKINLVVSKGVAPIPVPNVEGLTFDAAYATLAKRGFRVGKDEVFSDDVPKGKVVSQFPKSTEAKPANSLIIVRVSKGEEKKEDSDSKDDKKDEKDSSKDKKPDDDKKDDKDK
ncbi:serine/threonine protein kinase [Brevibacterium permense]|uniref:protein kinase domain-containing protein n=1 Tax=Brevibacterium permense TaxID=234834 RepID=UPI0021D3103D|nr:serine/threonine protein kinase [Brevibacterium permense]